jgi:cytochrome c-type biogenesis protein CcmF
LAGWDNAGKLATFKTYLNPLINWLWFGGLVFVIGTVVAVWPDAEAKRRAVGRQTLARKQVGQTV